MFSRNILAAATLSLSFVATLSFAQMAPNTLKPTPADQKLGVMVGSWVAHGTLKASPTGPAGKFSSTETCAWTARGFGIVCHSVDDIPDMGKVAGTSVVGYDSDAKNYIYAEVGAFGASFSRGTVAGNTWTWMSKSGSNYQRFTVKYISKNSCEWLLEQGPNPQSLKTVMQVTQTRVGAKTASGTNTIPRRPTS